MTNDEIRNEPEQPNVEKVNETDTVRITDKGNQTARSVWQRRFKKPCEISLTPCFSWVCELQKVRLTVLTVSTVVARGAVAILESALRLSLPVRFFAVKKGIS